MKSSSFPLPQKYVDFVNTVDKMEAEFLEGTKASGKTTVGAGVKFMRMVSRSRKKLHIIASKTTGTAEKNIIQRDNGILDIHPKARYYGNGDKWVLVLGSQFSCLYIGEINTANIDFVREVLTRNDYLLATFNPDDPNLPVYKEFINRSRPYKKCTEDVPQEIIAELTEEPVPKWRYWFLRSGTICHCQKRILRIDRIKLQFGWIQQGCCLIVDTCVEHLGEFDRYS